MAQCAVLSTIVASLTPFALTAARRGLAANPTAVNHLWADLVDDPDPEIRHAVAKLPEPSVRVGSLLA